MLEICLPFVKVTFDKASTLKGVIPMSVGVEHVNRSMDAKSANANQLSTVQRRRRTLRYWRRIYGCRKKQDAAWRANTLRNKQSREIESSQCNRRVRADGRNNVFTLAQGELVAVANLEAAYTLAPLVRQIFIYGSSERSNLLAVVVPAPVALAEYGNSQALKAALHRSLEQTAMAAQLRSYEVPAALLIETEPFTEEHGLLSGSDKLVRPQLTERYGDRLEGMYAEIA